MSRNTYEGPDAIAAFLNPANHVTPLVELPARLNPYRADGIRIFAKLMAFLPLGNVKSLPAWNMLEEAHTAGQLDGLHTLIESSSGNTVFSACVVARAVYGINRTIALASNEVEPGKLRALRLFGTEIEVIEEGICPDPDDPESGINQAKRRGQESGFFNPGQYDNEANPRAHARFTGPQLWEQTEGRIRLLATGLGTTGTLVGTSGYLKERNPSLETVGVIRIPNNPVPGVRTEGLLREIAFPWRDYVDHAELIGTAAAYESSRQLCSEGLMAGPSSGFAYAGLLAHLERERLAGRLTRYLDAQGEAIAVFIAPDGPFPYLEEYERYLGDDALPPLKDAHLLKQPIAPSVPIHFPDLGEVQEVEMDALMLADLLRDKTASPPLIVDIRSKREYDDHHLPSSVRVPLEDLTRSDEDWNIYLRSFRKQESIVFVCSLGLMSTSLALKAKESGVNAKSLKGGTMEWSRRGLERIRPVSCAPLIK